jgi:hypothetical protein
MFNIDEIKARVAKGFNALTREQRDAIDVHTLAMDSDWDCVLGQIFGRYAIGMELLFPGIPEDDYDERERIGGEHGFFQTYRDPDAFEIYEQIQREWVDLLCAERENVLS